MQREKLKLNKFIKLLRLNYYNQINTFKKYILHIGTPDYLLKRFISYPPNQINIVIRGELRRPPCMHVSCRFHMERQQLEIAVNAGLNKA